jgi:UDP-glucose 4-epimerase
MTVYQAEKMIKMKTKTTMNFSAVSLRCFNAAGAHPSGVLG